MEIKAESDIIKLLESGWLFVISDHYFDDVFFSKVPAEDKFRYGNGWFLKKSETLYRRLISMGMDKNSSSYDSSILMAMEKSGNDIRINLLSLKDSGNIEKVAKGIMDDASR